MVVPRRRAPVVQRRQGVPADAVAGVGEPLPKHRRGLVAARFPQHLDHGLGDVERAGRLWGAARHLQERTGTGLADYVRRTKELFGVPTPGDGLPEEQLERFAAEGAALSLDEVVAYAMEVPDATRSGTEAEVSS